MTSERKGVPVSDSRRVVGLEPQQPHYRVLIAEDRGDSRAFLAQLLTSVGFEICEATNGAEAVHLCLAFQPHIVLMDLRMPVMDGVETTRAILSGAWGPEGTPPHVVVLTTYDTDGDILRAVEAGATGYLLKDAPREDILTAVRAATMGQSALSPSVTTRLVGAARAAHPGPSRATAAGNRAARSAPVSLSPREREVLAAVARGLSNPQVGAELYVTEATVKTHLLRAYGKLGVDSRTGAVTEALRRGLLDLG